MTKAELRHTFLAERKALTTTEVSRRSLLITALFFDFLANNSLASEASILHTFLPIQRRNEVDTWPIVRHLWSVFRHIQVATSVTDVARNTLSHYLISPETRLVENHWGIPEPSTQDNHPLSPVDFRIVLVPLLVFDQQGHRVGYGGGYYDRFLADCRPDCLKIGLSLVEPVEQIDDVEETDVALNAFITPTQSYIFN